MVVISLLSCIRFRTCSEAIRTRSMFTLIQECIFPQPWHVLFPARAIKVRSSRLIVHRLESFYRKAWPSFPALAAEPWFWEEVKHWGIWISNPRRSPVSAVPGHGWFPPCASAMDGPVHTAHPRAESSR